MKEANLMRNLQLYATKLGARVLRNNVGLGFQGQPQYIEVVTNVTLHPGDLVLRKFRPIKFGLGEGSSDLIGWKSVFITPDMVGRKVAVFTAIETKTEKGKATQEQTNFIIAIDLAGGISGIVRSKEDLEKLLT